jgi:hypothetical protein
VAALNGFAGALIVLCATGRANAGPAATDEEPSAEPSAEIERSQRGAERNAPPIAAVLAAAYAASGLDHDPARGLARRARLAALVPWISVRAGRDTSWQDHTVEVDRGTTIDVRATWRLDRLVFDGRELQAAALQAARRRERQRLASQVIAAYFAWVRGTHSQESAAILDDLTNGWFSQQVSGLSDGSSGDRTSGLHGSYPSENLPASPPASQAVSSAFRRRP